MKQSTAMIGVVVLVAVAGAAILMVGTARAAPVINLYMTDPPQYSEDVAAINITFTSVELRAVGVNESWITLMGNSTTINLLDIVNSSQKLGSFSVPAGNYTEIRFMVSTAVAVIGNETVVLDIPSGNQTGLKVHFASPLSLAAGASVNMTIDIRADNQGIHNGMLIPSMHATITP